MTVRPYAPEDEPLITDWWQARHGALSDLPSVLFPPLSVIVEDGGGPVFFMVCYECFGSPVAFLEYPIGKPGRSLPEARAAFRFALRSLIGLAGKCVEPQADYSIFRASPSVALLRAIKEEGFVEEYPSVEHVQVIYQAAETEACPIPEGR